MKLITRTWHTKHGFVRRRFGVVEYVKYLYDLMMIDIKYKFKK